jgi:hypothetical protein
VELAVLGGVDNMHGVDDLLTRGVSLTFQFVKIYHGVHTLTVNQNLDNFPQLLPHTCMNARPENWNPRTAEEINANSLQEFYLSVFLTIVVAVPGGPYPDHYPERRIGNPLAVEESGFLRRSFHTHNRQNVSGILDKLATYRCRRLNRQILTA